METTSTQFSTFIPANQEDFKRAAKDLTRLYPALNLQQGQELLARMYGHKDLHDLQAQIDAGRPPGPYLDQLDDPLSARSRLLQRFNELTDGSRLIPSGHIDLLDLCLLDRREERRKAMDFHNDVIAEMESLDPKPDPMAKTSDYFQFVHRDAVKAFAQPAEGVFCLTRLGSVVEHACRYLSYDVENVKSEEEFNVVSERIWAICSRHRSNPTTIVYLLEHLQSLETDEDNVPVIPEDVAIDFWPMVLQAKKNFESVMPTGYRHRISEKLAGNGYGFGISNEPFFRVLEWGALMAETLGNTRQALAMARKALKHEPNGSWAAQQIIKRHTGKESKQGREADSIGR